MYKFPVSLPKDRHVLLTQAYKSTQLAAWYKARGLNYPEHLAIDIICGDPNVPAQTYGVPVVCPFRSARLVSSSEARMQIKHVTDEGVELIMGALHLERNIEKELYLEGEIIGYIGNIGYTNPAREIGRPFSGSHLHLSIVVNGKVDDPLKYFDMHTPFEGDDTGFEEDRHGIEWAIEEVRKWLRARGITPLAGMGKLLGKLSTSRR